MKRVILFLVLFVAFANLLFAGTASWNYNTQTGSIGTTYNWIDASSGNEITLVTSGNMDDGRAEIQWPFDFQIYDNQYTAGTDNISICTNGYIRFDGLANTSYQDASNYNLISTATNFGQIICVGIQDCNVTDANSHIYWNVTGTSPNRILTIEYYKLEINYSANKYADIEVQFYEGSNKIVMLFGDDDVMQTSADMGIHSGVDGYYYKWGDIDTNANQTWLELTIPTNPGPGIATNPNPIDGAINIAVDNNPDISWTNPSGAVYNEVYFGTDSTLVNNLNSTVKVLGDGVTLFSSYNQSSNLQGLTTYYWKIVEYDNSKAVTEGQVWQFKTVLSASWNYDTQIGSIGTTYNWIDASSGSDEYLTDDDTFSVYWPFDFQIYDEYYKGGKDHISICSNGYMRFDGLASENYQDASNYDLTSGATSLGQIICVGIQDCNLGDQTSHLYWKVFGNSPNRIFVIEYKDLEINYSANKYADIEVQFYEGSNKIVMLFGDDDVTQTSADMGIHSGVDGYYYKWGDIDTNANQTWLELTIPANSGPGIATNPNPIDGAINIAVDNSPDISWTNPSGAVYNEVYFGTDSTLVNNLNSTVKVLGDGVTLFSSYNQSSNLQGLTTYYWKIVEYDNSKAYTIGPLWKFSTINSCPNPSDQLESNISYHSVDLYWTENGTATTWQIEYGTTGFSLGNGTRITGIISNPYNLSGLSSGTIYDWYLRSDCSNEYSEWIGPHTFTTSCEDITTFPYVIDFEDNVPPPCWISVQVNGNNGAWSQETSGDNPIASPEHGSYFAKYNSYNVNVGNDKRLESGNIDFTSCNAAHLGFYMYHDTGYPDNDDRIQIQVYSGGVWNNVGPEFKRYDGSTGWKKHIVDITNYTGEVIKIGILAISDYGNNIFIDNLIINKSYVKNNNDVLFSEICDNKNGQSDDTGFIELYNRRPYKIDIGGDQISMGNINLFNDYTFIFPNSTIIDSLGYIVIANGANLTSFNSSWNKSVSSNEFYTDSNLNITSDKAYAYIAQNTTSKGKIDETPAIPSNSRAVRNSDKTWNTSTNPNEGTPGETSGSDEPLATVLVSFTATFQSNQLYLTWIISSQNNISQWNLYRYDENNFVNAKKIVTLSATHNYSGMQTYSFNDLFEYNTNKTYYYWIEGVYYNGSSELFGSTSITINENSDSNVPSIIKYGLRNYPNPFNPFTTIEFALRKKGKAFLYIFNIKGQLVKEINIGYVVPNKIYRYNWDGTDMNNKKLGNGVYFYKLKTENKTYLKKMILLK